MPSFLIWLSGVKQDQVLYALGPTFCGLTHHILRIDSPLGISFQQVLPGTLQNMHTLEGETKK